MAVYPIAYLRDDFEDNVTAPAWTKNQTGSATANETGGQAQFALPSSTAGSHDANYTSNASYDLTGDSFSIQIGTMVATGVAASAYVRLSLDASNSYQWIQSGGTIKAQKVVAGVATDLYSASWSSTNHKYLRIRESGGTVFFDSSANGTSWTNRGSTTIASAFAATLLTIAFGASCGNVSSPGIFRLDMVNLILPTPTSTWRWIDADWQIVNRMRPITLASTGNKQGVLVTAGGKDASGNLTGTLRYFAGPVGSASGGYAALTEYSTLVAAQANPFTIPIDGRVDLPTLVDCRIMRLYHRSSDGASGTIREYLPRRMIQADDIEAESIKAINIAAHSITADQIATVNLDATARITAGGGATTLDNHGLRMLIASSVSYGGSISGDRSLDFVTAAAALRAQLFAWDNGSGAANLEIAAIPGSGQKGYITLTAYDDAGAHNASMIIGAGGGASGNNRIYLTADEIWLWNAFSGTTDVQVAGNLTATAFTPGGVQYKGNLISSLANNATAALGIGAASVGLAFVHAGGAAAIYAINGAAHTVAELADAAGIYTGVQGTASSVNIYWNSITSRYEIENKRGTAIAVRVWYLES